MWTLWWNTSVFVLVFSLLRFGVLFSRFSPEWNQRIRFGDKLLDQKILRNFISWKGIVLLWPFFVARISGNEVERHSMKAKNLNRYWIPVRRTGFGSQHSFARGFHFLRISAVQSRNQSRIATNLWLKHKSKEKAEISNDIVKLALI